MLMNKEEEIVQIARVQLNSFQFSFIFHFNLFCMWPFFSISFYIVLQMKKILHIVVEYCMFGLLLRIIAFTA